MKRDLLVALAGILIVCALTFGLVSAGHLQPPQLTPPSAGEGAATSTGAAAGNVIMRVNGEPVTDREFALFMQTLPEQMQALAATPGGRNELANQIVKLKVLEQEGRKLGAARDPEVATKMEFGKTNVYVEYALQKIAKSAGDAELRADYEKNKASFASTELSHILVAYRGGAIPPRSGEALPLEDAMKKAQAIEAKLRSGAEFGPMAAQYSDDQTTADSGGSLGPVAPGALPPDVQSVIDHLGKGEISGPVRTQFGIHIFKVIDRKAQTFEEVKPLLQRRAQQNAVTAAVERLQKSAKVERDPRFFGTPEPPRG